MQKNTFDASAGGDSHVHASYKGMRLSSAFQPIYSLSHCRIVGYEGLLRATIGEAETIVPTEVFGSARSEVEIVQLDRLSRALHMHNFASQHDDMNWLFLNIDPKVIVQGKYYGSFFKDLLDYYEMPPSRVVVEIIEGAISDESQLSESVEFYKKLGCLVAIDDFGAGHSNFERIWRLAPNIVKLDRSMIAQAVDNRTARRVLPGIVSLIHEVGSLVLIEGVETLEEAMIAIETDVDFVQGFYFGMPEANVLQEKQSKQIADLFRDYHDTMPQEMHYKKLSKHIAAFAEVVSKMQSGFAMEQACQGLLEIRGVDRCYLLNQYGIQIGTSIVVPSRQGVADIRYHPLADGNGANWIRRPYLRRALNRPKELQLTRPYLSIANGKLCVTISIAITVLNQIQVFCCDVDWE
ncbi:diguanylate phosphodiesterase [Methylovorus sp. MM2]|uniref:sensor domain-containing phosphodiesterase n=1 Tax=Methylovorus sp. MM2 TaxID=1848038 RepID=UPI0007E090E1|nr:EAL domain-containing protein [Methylovorus sp. MM2]OAM53279.1 diguanylate phosphodiesterase [Methylovorus sp. MM2]